MVKQRKHCEASIARVYSEHVRSTPLICSPPPISLETCCIQTKTKDKYYTDTDPVVSRCLREMVSDEYNGAQVNVCLWTIHKRAQVCGIKFTSDNPLSGVRRRNEKMKRCGSVITLVRGVDHYMSGLFDSCTLINYMWPMCHGCRYLITQPEHQWLLDW